MFTLEEKDFLLFHVNQAARRIDASIGHEADKEYGNSKKIKEEQEQLAFILGLKDKIVKD